MTKRCVVAISAAVLLLGCSTVMTGQECQEMCAAAGENVHKYEQGFEAAKCTCTQSQGATE